MEIRNTNNPTLAILMRCKSTVDKVYPLQRDINTKNEQIRVLLEKSKGIKNYNRPVWQIILFYILICIVSIILPFSSVILLPALIFCILYIVRKKKNQALIDEVSILPSLQEEVKKNEQKLLFLLQSNEGQFALANIPRDYFYPNAVDRFIFYFTNGHVETMKEAVREYDGYMHNCKMEYEAARAADANERAAAAAERAARAAESNARNTAAMRSSVETIEQYTNNINFWTTYNSLFR